MAEQAPRDIAAGCTPYPPPLVQDYRRSGLWGNDTISQQLLRVARTHPDQPAVISAEGTMSFAGLNRRTDQLAVGLRSLGLEPHDRVLLQVGNQLSTVLAWYGLLKAGLIPVCTLDAHGGHEIGEISRRVGAVGHLVDAGSQRRDLVTFARAQQDGHPTLRQIITLGADGLDLPAVEDLGSDIDAADAAEEVAAIQRTLDPDGVAVLQLSGGTTGTPKVIPRLHAEYWYNAEAYARAWNWGRGSRVGHMIPLVHNAGITCALHAAHSVGAALVLATPVLDQALPLLARAGTTDVLLGHGHWSAVEHPAFAPLTRSLRRVILSGAKVPPGLTKRLEEADIWFGQLFGMGEGLFTITPLEAPPAARASTVGVPLSPRDEVVLLEPAGDRPVPDGEVGELCCRGPYTIRGYYDAAEHNTAAFTTDGYYRTGDLAAWRTIEGTSHLSIEGRIKDLVNRGGEKVNVAEVEGLLVDHPRVREAAVVSMPDARLGERACAYLVTDGQPVDLQDVQAHFRRLDVAKFKWPERIELVDALPRTLVGKVDKRRLRDDITSKLTTTTESPA
jgi:non-ribosomal peptide synthetase component E (peptide arylation enzyme)